MRERAAPGRPGGALWRRGVFGDLAETDSTGAQQIAEHIREAVERLPKVEGAELPVTVSIGIGTWTAGCEITLERLLFAADKALYQAKDAGRNRVVAASF